VLHFHALSLAQCFTKQVLYQLSYPGEICVYLKMVQEQGRVYQFAEVEASGIRTSALSLQMR